MRQMARRARVSAPHSARSRDWHVAVSLSSCALAAFPTPRNLQVSWASFTFRMLCPAWPCMSFMQADCPFWRLLSNSCWPSLQLEEATRTRRTYIVRVPGRHFTQQLNFRSSAARVLMLRVTLRAALTPTRAIRSLFASGWHAATCSPPRTSHTLTVPLMR